MLKYTDYDIVFQEVPDEVTLAINLSLCPNGCIGCHSPQLKEDIGEELTETALEQLLLRYGTSVTCVCFMGGDNDPQEVARLAAYIKKTGHKAAWYSGRAFLPGEELFPSFDYIKVGPYLEEFGPLKSETTNQRFYRVTPNGLEDITSRFWRETL